MQYQSTLSLVPSTVSSTGPPLSIQLAKPSQTMSVTSEVPGSIPGSGASSSSSLVVLRQPATVDNKPVVDSINAEHDILLNNSKSVRELWINSHKKAGPTTVINSHHHGTTTSRPVSLVPSAMAHLEPIIDNGDLKRQDDGAMHIRELLLKTKGATILEPADPPPPPPPQTIENTKNNQLVIQVNKNPLDPQKMQLTLPNVSLILTTSASTTSTPSLTVTSIPAPKARILPPHNLITSHTSSNIHQREYCDPMKSVIPPPNQQIHQQQSIITQLREARLPEKPNARKLDDIIEDTTTPNKKPKLMLLPQVATNTPPMPQLKSLQNTTQNTSGIVTFSKTTIHPVQQHATGLLQIATNTVAKPTSQHAVQPQQLTSQHAGQPQHQQLQQIQQQQQQPQQQQTNEGYNSKPPLDLKGISISTNTITNSNNSGIGISSNSSFASIPGIPVPNMTGVLTGIKSPPSQLLFSLPGKIIV